MPSSGEQYGNDSREEDAIEGSCSSDGGYRRAQVGYLVEVHQVCTDERPHHTTDVGNHTNVMGSAKEIARERRYYRRDEHRRRNSQPRYRAGKAMNHEGDNHRAEQRS